jgi:hypothetical protein
VEAIPSGSNLKVDTKDEKPEPKRRGSIMDTILGRKQDSDRKSQELLDESALRKNSVIEGSNVRRKNSVIENLFSKTPSEVNFAKGSEQSQKGLVNFFGSSSGITRSSILSEQKSADKPHVSVRNTLFASSPNFTKREPLSPVAALERNSSDKDRSTKKLVARKSENVLDTITSVSNEAIPPPPQLKEIETVSEMSLNLSTIGSKSTSN